MATGAQKIYLRHVPLGFWVLMDKYTGAPFCHELQHADGDAVGEVLASRWSLPMPAVATQYSGVAAGAQLFDHRAFAISSAEAATMDPQQRWVLRTSYASLAAAALTRAHLMHTCQGVAARRCSRDNAVIWPSSSVSERGASESFGVQQRERSKRC